jgi:hypothetical protein
MVAYFINEGVMVNGVFYSKDIDAKVMQEVMYNIRISIPRYGSSK